MAAPVSGVLRNAAGEPVAGVKVYSFLMGQGRTKANAYKPEATAVTDDHGEYSLGELPSLAKNQWRYTVAYTRGEYIGWTVDSPDIADVEGYVGGPRPLTVTKAVTRTGRVVDETGRAMVGVKVNYLGLLAEQKYPTFLPCEVLKAIGVPTQLMSAKDGTYRVTDAAVGSGVMVEPQKKGFAARDAHIDTADLKIVLVRSGRIEGRVVDSAGKPLGDTCVVASLHENSPGAAVTNANGHFVLEDLAPGSWHINAQRRGQVFPTASAMVTAGNTTHIAGIRSIPTTVVTGTVVYAENDRPVSGQSIAIHSSDLTGYTSDNPAKTDANGAFKTTAPVGRDFVWLMGLPRGYVLDNANSVMVVPKTGLTGLRLRLVKAQVARGRVTDTSGKPVSDAEVSFYDEGDDPVRTGADGTFTLTVPSAGDTGMDLVVYVNHEKRHLAAIQQVPRSDATDKDLDLVARPMDSVRVHVTLPNGKPAEGARVSEIMTTGDETSSTSSDGFCETRTDGNGDATAGSLVAGATFKVVASLPGYTQVSSSQVITPGGNAPRVVNIRLVRAARVQEGKVVDEKGRPVAGVDVSAEGAALESIATAQTDAKGHFVLHGLPDCKVDLNAYKDGRWGGAKVDKSSRLAVIRIRKQEF